MAVVYIKNLVVEGKHGVHQHEKETSQPLNISVELIFDTSKAAASDNVDDTLNWSQIRQKIIDTIQNNSFNLMERLAQEIADQLLKDERIQKIIITIDKLQAFETGVPGIKLEVNNSKQ